MDHHHCRLFGSFLTLTKTKLFHQSPRPTENYTKRKHPNIMSSLLGPSMRYYRGLAICICMYRDEKGKAHHMHIPWNSFRWNPPFPCTETKIEIGYNYFFEKVPCFHVAHIWHLLPCTCNIQSVLICRFECWGGLQCYIDLVFKL